VFPLETNNCHFPADKSVEKVPEVCSVMQIYPEPLFSTQSLT
jgi:hypothetical protein